ncbi:MAG: ABC transporter ATP-binding protein [Acutalibacteraceae bacterium]|nr:ABC transporter ATP-binding protein [Acutalibacteraceae bacterium]
MIKATKLTKIFDGKTALSNLDLEINDGSIYGLIGSNGSGKSTLLRLAAGIYTPDSGKITADGEKIFDNFRKKTEIAYLGDTPYFMPHATIRETAKLYRTIYPNFDNALYNRLLEIFPLDYKAKIATMSKGMQRQAALIMAIASSPKYLLLDEAFDGLDPVIRKVLKSILIEGAENRSMTTVIASHNLRELEDLCDSVGLIHSGSIIFSDPIDVLKGKLHKVQMAFRQIPEVSVFSGLDMLKIERSGSVINMIVRGDQDEIMAYINRLSPIFSECIEPTLEEMFIYELGVTGYDVKSIIS